MHSEETPEESAPELMVVIFNITDYNAAAVFCPGFMVVFSKRFIYNIFSDFTRDIALRQRDIFILRPLDAEFAHGRLQEYIYRIRVAMLRGPCVNEIYRAVAIRGKNQLEKMFSVPVKQSGLLFGVYTGDSEIEAIDFFT